MTMVTEVWTSARSSVGRFVHHLQIRPHWSMWSMWIYLWRPLQASILFVQFGYLLVQIRLPLWCPPMQSQFNHHCGFVFCCKEIHVPKVCGCRELLVRAEVPWCGRLLQTLEYYRGTFTINSEPGFNCCSP